MVLGGERQRRLQLDQRLVGGIDRDLLRDELVPGADPARGQLLNLDAAEELDRVRLGPGADARSDDRPPRLAREQGAHDVADLELIAREGDRPDDAALGLEPSRDGVGDGHRSICGAIGAPVECGDKLGAPLLGVLLPLEEPLLALAGARVAPVQDEADLFDDRAVLQFATANAAGEVDVERHGEPVDQKQNENTRRQRQQLFPSSHPPGGAPAIGLEDRLRGPTWNHGGNRRRRDRPGDGRDIRPVGMSGSRDHSRLSGRRGRTKAERAWGRLGAAHHRTASAGVLRGFSRRVGTISLDGPDAGSQRRPQKPETRLPKLGTAHEAAERVFDALGTIGTVGTMVPVGEGGGRRRPRRPCERGQPAAPFVFRGSRNSYK